MKMKLLTAGLLTSLMMAGSALAMDSETIEKHMDKINDQYVQTSEEEGKVEALEEKVKTVRETSDKYILAMFYGSHFEKANFARAIENFLCDIARDPEFAKQLCTQIIDRNMVMLENILSIDRISILKT